ncbi:MAG: MerR family transcriptional regulator [Planctomycetia bacterium]|nr:MerR family transcriptional regulator [Planctomycetia bacterium]
MLTIGEFSKATGLTVKALRFYHDQGLLVPAFVDDQTGYRYYSLAQVEVARGIAYLRQWELPLAEIKEILGTPGGEQTLDILSRHKRVLEERLRHFRKTIRSLDQFIAEERQAIAMAESDFDVQEKVLEPVLVAGVRMRGRYDECGRAFAKIGRALGRHIGGSAMLLHYDAEFKEDDADFEACMPIRKAATCDAVSVRELPGGACASLLHRGPYDQLGHSYAKILDYVRQHGYRIAMPTREVYLKGPGMIFKGRPKNYLTEIQILVEKEAKSG